MATKIYLGNPTANAVTWIKAHAAPAIDLTKTRFTLQDGTVEEYDIIGALDKAKLANIGYWDDNNYEWLKTITEVEIGTNVTNIGYSAFQYCYTLTHVSIPDSVSTIENYGFSECNNLLYDTTTYPGLILVNGWIVGYNDNYELGYEEGQAWVTLYLDNSYGIRGIQDNALQSCEWVNTVVFNCFNMSGYAFLGCTNLKDVLFENKLNTIGYGVFENCSKLRSVIFQNKTLEQVLNIEDIYGNKQYPWGISDTSIITVT